MSIFGDAAGAVRHSATKKNRNMGANLAAGLGAIGHQQPRRAAAPKPAAPAAPAAAAAPAATGYDALGQSQKDWVDELTALFKQNGLESLAGTLTNLVTGGYQGSALTLALQDSDAYKTRFSGNEARKKAGIPVLSPAEYLSTENAYRQVLSQAGLPAGFYDDPSDFANFIADDKSPAEIQSRANDYLTVAKNTDPAYRKMISDTFGVGLSDGDIAAFMLDPHRAMPLLEKTANAIGVADAARKQGLGYSADRANQLTELGVTADQAGQAYGQIAEMKSAYGRGAAAYGEDYTQTDAENESLLGMASAKRKRQKIEDTFNAYQSGSSRTASGALKRDDSQSY